MNDSPRPDQPNDLLGIIGHVRRRWRTKLVVRGAVTVALICAVLFFAAAWLLEWARFSGPAIIGARVVLLAAAVASIGWFLVRPIRRQVTDEQVALYLEEREPSLQASLVSAVEASREGRAWESSALVQKLVQQAIERCTEAGALARVERVPIQRYASALGAIALIAILAVSFGPAFLRSALSAILLVQRSVEAAAPYRIEVTPGNASIPKGADQAVSAKLVGFDAVDATIMVRRAPAEKFEALPLLKSEGGDYEAILFDVTGPVEYYVEAEGVRSTTFTLQVVDIPYAQRIQLEYRFPAYTGLDPQIIEDGGDVAVLRGTEVHLRVFPTMKTPGGAIALNDKDRVTLGAPDKDGALAASVVAREDGFYHVELIAPNGEKVTASPRYSIDVLTDGVPTVSFGRPGRDTSASAIEEVFVEANAQDDFGVRDLELVYSVNGGPEKTVKLYGGAGKRLPEVTAGHTFYLEELGVQPGDAVSYYARANDNGAGGGQAATSDLYFLRVRPFKQDFRQAQSQGGGGGGGGGGADQVDALSEQQRQIISATFNVQRDRKSFTPAKLRENSTVVGLSQSRLREQVENLITRMNSQLVQQDPAFQKIVQALPQAVAAMKDAEAQLAKVSPEAALPSEHKALQILQKAEEEYQIQVQSQQGGGGGGGGGSQQQQELADIFEQELDKLASRYETAGRATQESRDKQVDELLEKLKELARRQQQEAERQRRRALENGSGNSGAGGASGGSNAAQQRALAEQVEEAARRLERLAREENRQDLQDAARQMRDAADNMRKAAAGGDGNAAQQAQRALERLQETEKKLQRGLSDRAERDIKDAQEQAEQLARDQQEIASGIRGLNNLTTGRRAEEGRKINERKDALEQKLGELESRLDSAARDASAREKESSRKLADAAGTIRNNRLRDKVRYSKALVNRGISPDSMQANENDIASGIDDVREKLDQAAASLGAGGGGDKTEEAVDKARRLARGLESLQERTRERAERGQNGGQQGQGQQGQNGQQGDQNGQQAGNQPGQGQQGQGQQGQQGQQGRGQQGQGQGQGQQGQQAGNQPGQGQQGQGGQQGQQQGQGQGGGQGGQQGQPGQGQQAGNQPGQAGGQMGGGNINGGIGGGAQLDNRGFGNNFGNGTLAGWSGRLSPEDIRQLQAEMRQWSGEAQDLRGLLRGQNIDPKELDEILKAFRQLQDDRVYQNASELQRLQGFVAEGIKRFEFDLRRKLDADEGGVALSGSDDVPAEFRKLVEQYYRSLSKSQR